MRARLVIGTIAVLLLGGAPGALAQQPASDVFSTVGEDDKFAVGAARHWFDNHTAEQKQRASGCLGILEEAKALQDTALDLYAQARQPGNRNASELVKQANAFIALRSDKLEEFKDCVNAAMRGDQFASNGDGGKGVKRTSPPPGGPPLATDPPPASWPPPPDAPPPAPPKTTPVRIPQPQPPRWPDDAYKPPKITQKTLLVDAVDDCLRWKFADYVGPDWKALRLKTIRTNQADPFGQAFVLARMAAEKALDIDEAKYGAWSDRELMRDYLVGWVTHCLSEHGKLSEADPRPRWSRMVNESSKGAERRADRKENFFYGYSSYPLPPFWDHR